jgi:hypothetical protein
MSLKPLLQGCNPLLIPTCLAAMCYANSPTAPMPPLPSPTPSARHFPECCLSLSTSFLTHFSTQLPRNGLVLSIASGSGLFEACIQHANSDISVEGVEVRTSARESSTGESQGSEEQPSSVNRFLSPSAVHIVNGSWELCRRAEDAHVWLFVYPRQPALVSAYMRSFERGRVGMAIWLGARADWDDFADCFTAIGFDLEIQQHQECGLVEYEMMVVARKRGLEGLVSKRIT